MIIYKLLYNHLLPGLFKVQNRAANRFIWVPILGDVFRIKQRTVNRLNLQRGSNVLVYSIGAGYELDFIVDRVGKEGSVVGVDLSEGMLKIAREKINKNNWANIKLVLADVREYNPLNSDGHAFDAALSNFGYLDERVLHNLLKAIKTNGTIAISGPQPLTGIRKIFYPITFVPEMLFGLTWKTLHKFPMYVDILKKELNNVGIDDKTFAKYFVAVSGSKKL